MDRRREGGPHKIRNFERVRKSFGNWVWDEKKKIDEGQGRRKKGEGRHCNLWCFLALFQFESSGRYLSRVEIKPEN